MKHYFFSLFILLSLFACKKEQNKNGLETDRISANVEMTSRNGEFQFRSHRFNYSFTKREIPVKRAVVLNASLLGYFAALGAENQLAGVSSPEYIYSDKIKNLIAQGKIQNVGNEQKYDIEKILTLKPDAVFTNYISSFENTYDLMTKNGIKVIFLDEYTEQKPLEKAAYLKLFARLLGKESLAEAELRKITDEYLKVKKLATGTKQKPIVISNEMYGNQWFMPGGKTQLANLIADAGGHYILKENTDEKAIPLSFEEVLAKADKADFWVNAGNHSSKKSLLTVNPNYAAMKVYQQGKIYALTGREDGKSNDFFESGVVRADLVLKDYVKIFHPDLLPDHELIYLKELK